MGDHIFMKIWVSVRDLSIDSGTKVKAWGVSSASENLLKNFKIRFLFFKKSNISYIQ